MLTPLSIARPRFLAPASFSALLTLLSGCGGGGGGGGPAPIVNAGSISGRLAISATAPRGPVVIEQEPNSTDFQVQYLGIADTATHAEIFGQIGDDGTDNFDGFRFRTTAAMRVKVTIDATEPTSAANLDMFWFDATTRRLLQLVKGTTNPETGTFIAVVGDMEFDLIVYSSGGASGYHLTIETAPVQPSLRIDNPGEEAPFEALMRWRGARHPMIPGEIVALLQPEAGHSGPTSLPYVPPAGMTVRTQHADLVVIHDAESCAAVLSDDGQALATCDAAERVRKSPRVRAASPNYLCRSATRAVTPAVPTSALARATLPGLPSDEHLALQWSLTQIRAQDAWEAIRGSSDVTIAVLDSGIASRHPDLSTRLIAGYDFISDPKRAGDGTGIDPDPEEPRRAGSVLATAFHGTLVTGILGADTDNRTGIAGVDWLAKVMPIRVLTTEGTGTVADIAEGLRFAARLPNASGTLPAKRADVICLSFGTAATSPVLEAAIHEARGSGCVLVAAAGNDSGAADIYPAAYPACISVGATRFDRELAPYSSYAANIDIVAPGGDTRVDQNGDSFPDGILSTTCSDVDKFSYRFAEGTSMAVPQVAAAAALVKAAKPTLTASEIEQILLSTTRNLGTPPRGSFPFRLLDVQSAVVAAQNSVPTEPKLVIDAGSIDLGTSTSSWTVRLQNTGTRLITVKGTRTFYAGGSGWLTVGLDSPTPLLSASRMTLAVNRTGLATGVYAAAVEIQAIDQFPLRVHLIVRVGDPGPIQDRVNVLLVDATTLKTVAQAETDAAQGFVFALTRLPAGEYFLVAGTDRNGNSLVGDQGEFYGTWPNLEQPTILSLAKDQSLGNVDFGVYALTYGLSTNSSGFALLR